MLVRNESTADRFRRYDFGTFTDRGIQGNREEGRKKKKGKRLTDPGPIKGTIRAILRSSPRLMRRKGKKKERLLPRGRAKEVASSREIIHPGDSPAAEDGSGRLPPLHQDENRGPIAVETVVAFLRRFYAVYVRRAKAGGRGRRAKSVGVRVRKR